MHWSANDGCTARVARAAHAVSNTAALARPSTCVLFAEQVVVHDHVLHKGILWVTTMAQLQFDVVQTIQEFVELWICVARWAMASAAIAPRCSRWVVAVENKSAHVKQHKHLQALRARHSHSPNMRQRRIPADAPHGIVLRLPAPRQQNGPRRQPHAVKQIGIGCCQGRSSEEQSTRFCGLAYLPVDILHALSAIVSVVLFHGMIKCLSASTACCETDQCSVPSGELYRKFSKAQTHSFFAAAHALVASRMGLGGQPHAVEQISVDCRRGGSSTYFRKVQSH